MGPRSRSLSVRSGLLVVALAVLAVACGQAAGGPDEVTGPAPTVRIEIGEASETVPPPAPSGSVLDLSDPARAGGTAVDGSPAAIATEPTAGPGSTPVGGDGATGSDPSADTASPATTARSGPPPVAADPNPSVVAHAVVDTVVARVSPSDDAAPVATLAHPTPVGSPLVFRAVPGASAVAGWLEVQLPVQPNGTTGWVRRDDVTLFENPYRIEVDRAEHRLVVFHRGEPWIDATIAVGTGATPTPVGEFYLLELLAPPDPTGPYGPYAFGLSGFSEVLDSFGGADTAIIGLHGTDDPDALGTDVSFGCIRLANDVIEQLAATLPLGTPVVIT